MSNAAKAQAQIPGIVMMAAGAVFLLFYLFYTLWTGFYLLTGCMGTGTYAMLAATEGDGGLLMGAGCAAWSLLMTCLSVVAYLALAIGGAFVGFAGLNLQNLKSQSRVKQGMIAAGAIPLVGILVNVLAGVGSLSVTGMCGAVTGTVPQILPLALGVAAAAYTYVTLQDETVAGAFEE